MKIRDLLKPGISFVLDLFSDDEKILDMIITVNRITYTQKSTIGELLINDQFYCYTLEDVVRAKKIKHETAISAGRYEVIVNYSNRFKKPLPLLLNVPEFMGVRIHAGNTAADTSGCILVGMTKAHDFIGNSRTAFNGLMDRIELALKSGKVWIQINENKKEV